MIIHLFLDSYKIFFQPFLGPPLFMTPEGMTTPLGILLSLMVESGISNHPHPSIASIYFEVVNRYSGFFEKHINYLPIALQSFLDARGLFHPVKSVRLRTNYLFLKFVKSMKKFLVPYVEGMLTVLQVFSFDDSFILM